jgi:hypothetical protein
MPKNDLSPIAYIGSFNFIEIIIEVFDFSFGLAFEALVMPEWGENYCPLVSLI